MDDIKNIERRVVAKKMIDDGFEKNTLINLAIGILEECLANEDIIYVAAATNNNIFSLDVIKHAIDTYNCCGDSSKSFVNMIIKDLNKNSDECTHGDTCSICKKQKIYN